MYNEVWSKSDIFFINRTNFFTIKYIQIYMEDQYKSSQV